MKKLRIIIADDEPLALEFLRSILSATNLVDIIAECANGREALEAAAELRPDLLFLDIQMPGMNGFEVVKALQADMMPMVIFVTAFNQYAVDAFDLHAVDYILKPLDSMRVGRALERAIIRFESSESKDHKSPLMGAISNISDRISAETNKQSPDDIPQGMKNKLVVRDSGVVKIIPFENIDWVDAAGDYMCVHAVGETHVIRSTLTEMMSKLDDNRFARIHRSTIVNIERVISITPLQKGGSLLHLVQGETLKVSRNYRESIRSLFQ